MPFLADFKCTNNECKHIVYDVFFKTFADFEENKLKQFCPLCSKQLEHVILSCQVPIIAETNDPISAKPSSYWRNAEAVKQSDLRKRAAAEREKNFYGKNGMR